MNFLLNQIEVLLNSEVQHLCLVWTSTVLCSRVCPLWNAVESGLLSYNWLETSWGWFGNCVSETVSCAKWVSNTLRLWNRQWNLRAANCSIYLFDSPPIFIFSTVYRGCLFGSSPSYSEFSYCGSLSHHLLFDSVCLLLVSSGLRAYTGIVLSNGPRQHP